MEKRKNDSKIWRRVCGLLLAYKKYFPGIFICLVCTSFMTFLQPLVIRRITDQGMVEKDMECILIYSGVLVGISVIVQVTEVIQTRLFSNIHNGLTFSLYRKAYWKMDNLSIGYYDEKGSAEIANMIGSDISNVASVADQITTFSISSILQIVGGIVGLSILDWKLALMITLMIPVKFLVVLYFSIKKNEAFERLIENNRVFFGWLGDCINGIREMKLWDLFRIKNPDFEKLQGKMMDSYRENMMLDEYRTFSVSMLDALMNAVLYILGGLLIVRGELTIGGAFAFMTYSAYVVSPISFLINIKYYFAQIKPSAKRYFEFLEQPEEGGEHAGSLSGFDKEAEVPVLELKDVIFGYKEGTPILNGVNLTVQQGDRIAVIGENGSGKSTLLDLILGFYHPEKGEIKFWGIPAGNLEPKIIRNRIAVVSQKPYLFLGTIEENVNIGGTASHEDVVDACIKSGAITFIEKLEDGFMQRAGQDGAKLSGGEKQKVAVARAILKKADILLLDEATSGFDRESDKALINLVRGELKDKTIIFITHRYEELEGVEKVYRLAGGQLELMEGQV
ncbi:ABC transporter ATP-binding protein [Faecalicatena orotica]|uniref:ABC transporter ATP-binding protein n=1 Tax=Faecalicatena orotica TaxID=1544 RepID=UPI003217AA54